MSTPIVVTNGIGDDEARANTSGECTESIVLPGPMMDRVHRALERGLKAVPTSNRITTIAFCCPRNDDSIAVDAAVRRSAHSLRLDILTVDAERLADEEQRIFAPDFDSALYNLYMIKNFDASVPAHNEALARAVIHLRDFISTRNPEARPSRPRVLYLRNFAAMSYVLRPLLHALRAAIDECEMSILVVAGIWPVTQLREPRVEQEPTAHDADEAAGHPAGMFQIKHDMFMSNFTFVRKSANTRKPQGGHDEFLAAFRTPDALRSYVEGHFVPRDVSLRTPRDRFASLADVFQAGMMQHYGVQRLHEAADDSSEDDAAPNSPSTRFEFAEVLPIVAEHTRPIPGRAMANVATQVARWNLKRLSSALRNLGINARPCLVWASEWETPIATGGSATVRKLCMQMSQRDLDTLATDVQLGLPSAVPTYAELLAGIRHFDAVTDALQSHISRIRGDQTRTNQLVDAAIAKLVRVGRLEEGDIQLLRTLVVDPATFSTRYADVIVTPAVMEAVQSGIASAANPSSPGGILDDESPGGILLFGPPGTGKTMLCRAIAKECGVRFMHVRPSDIHSHYSGISEKTMRCIFDLARSLEGCIVFFDEIDSLFARRGGGGSSEKFFRSILSEFLQEMDGLATASANKSANVTPGEMNRSLNFQRPKDVESAAARHLPRVYLVVSVLEASTDRRIPRFGHEACTHRKGDTCYQSRWLPSAHERPRACMSYNRRAETLSRNDCLTTRVCK